MSEKESLQKVCAQMISAMTDAVILVDPVGVITRVNQATISLLGYSEDEIIDKPFQMILSAPGVRQAEPHPDGDETSRFIDDVLSNIEGLVFPKNGEPIPISLRSSSVMDDFGDMSGIVLVARDLRATKELIAKVAMVEAERRKHEELQQAYDELKRLQEQLVQSEKMASIGQIAAGVAHEINNPISGIMVYMRILADDLEKNELDNKQAIKYLNDSQHELRRCSNIIKSLLDFSRQSHPKLSHVALGEILAETFSILGHKARLQDIEVIQDIDPGFPGVRADPDQLMQVFLNLILNAIQAMPQGGRLTISAVMADDKGGLNKSSRIARIDIEDTGCGISEENIGKLFTPFFTTKDKGEGVGLGLAVVYGIIKRHGGNILVESSPGKGTTFSIFLECNDESGKKNDSRGAR